MERIEISQDSDCLVLTIIGTVAQTNVDLTVTEALSLIDKLQRAVSPLLPSAIEPSMPTAPYREKEKDA